MENVKIYKDYENSIEKYIDMHPYVKTILIEESNQKDFEVLYANSLAINYFSKEINVSAQQFFGDFWSKIHRETYYLEKCSMHTSEFKITINGEETLFQLDLQKGKGNEGQSIIFIELRKQKDKVAKSEIQSDYQHKYESVIDHNLDPIISINENWHITNANIAVHKVFGYREKELFGCLIMDYVKEEQAVRFKRFLTQVFSGESMEVVDVFFYHEKGAYLLTHIKALPVFIEGEIREVHLIVRDTSVHHENNEKLLFLSYHDQLTGLWNRKALKENFKEDKAMAIKYKENLSFIQLGLDRFKLINDSLGHNGADEILKKVAERLTNIFGKSGRIHRNGGDEFVITMLNHSVEETEEFAQRILDEFGKPFYYNHQEYFISASIGISMYPKDGDTSEKLIQKSAQALFYVKDHGRSHYRFYEKEMNNLIQDEALMESHLRRAIEFDELKVYYQPQVDLRTGHISSFEALLRWNNKKFGFVSPGQFIPIAEESGLIHSIGDWVLDQVCMQLKEWQDKRFRNVRIAVNISPKQFRMMNFSRKVKEKIEQYGIISSSLEVEITESALANMKETLKTLNELKKIGVFVSVDDFGTGYSSLSYLKLYPIDIIKIDRSFIQDIETDEKNKAIAKTIINLAHNLGMEVIAEGVEKELQAEILLEANCQKAQGFLYSKAVPVEEIINKYFAMSL